MSFRKALYLTAIVLLLTAAVCGIMATSMYLVYSMDMEPMLSWEFNDSSVFIVSMGEEFFFPLQKVNSIVGQIQYYWIFLPRNFRFSLQLLTWFFTG